MAQQVESKNRATSSEEARQQVVAKCKTDTANHGAYVSWDYVGTATMYGLLYAACALLLATALFARRDFV